MLRALEEVIKSVSRSPLKRRKIDYNAPDFDKVSEDFEEDLESSDEEDLEDGLIKFQRVRDSILLSDGHSFQTPLRERTPTAVPSS